MKSISLTKLKKAWACDNALITFKNTFYDGRCAVAEITEDNCQKFLDNYSFELTMSFLINWLVPQHKQELIDYIKNTYHFLGFSYLPSNRIAKCLKEVLLLALPNIKRGYML